MQAAACKSVVCEAWGVADTVHQLAVLLLACANAKSRRRCTQTAQIAYGGRAAQRLSTSSKMKPREEHAKYSCIVQVKATARAQKAVKDSPLDLPQVITGSCACAMPCKTLAEHARL